MLAMVAKEPSSEPFDIGQTATKSKKIETQRYPDSIT